MIPTLGQSKAVRNRLLRVREERAQRRVRVLQRRSGVPVTFPKTGGSTVRVRCIIVSKDRPLQLDACLRSIDRFAPYLDPIFVLSKATTAEFAEGYRIVAAGTRAQFRAESGDFRRDVMDLLDPASEHSMFLTDDDLFYRAPPVAAGPTDECAAVSLRLGANTTYCYALARDQPIPAFISHGPFKAWDWTRASDDFAYPMSMDGNVIHTALLRRIFDRARFANPNEQEEEMHLRRYLAPAWMLGFGESCLVNIPANIVSPTHRNRAGTEPALAARALNERFLSGERLDLEAMDFSSVRGAHQEIALVFGRIDSKK
jgi:hypothetical protein